MILGVGVMCTHRKQEEKGLLTHDPSGRVSLTWFVGASQGRGKVSSLGHRGSPLPPNLYCKCFFVLNPRRAMTFGCSEA